MISGIYKITNNINNKAYIGKSGDIENRWYSHVVELENNRHGNEHLQNSWNKHKENNFLFEILKEINDDIQLKIAEICYIYLYDSDLSDKGYNKTVGGEDFGYCYLSDETKTKRNKAISQALKGRQIKNRITTGMLGKNHSEKTKQKISENRKGILAWNKGLTIADKRVKSNITEKSKSTQFKKGNIPWNKRINVPN